MDWTKEQLDEIFEHLAYLRDSMESMEVSSIRNNLADMKQSMIRIQAMGDQMALQLASMIGDLERANTKSK
jgi:hypothetical protein